MIAVRRAVATLAAGAALVACGDGETARETTVRPMPAASTPAPLPGRPLCLGTGHWEECTLPDRLERAGLVPIAKDTLRRPWLAVPGRTWQLYRATLHVFRYADSTARARDLATLDTLRAVPRGDTASTWGGRATLLANDNLLAILVADDGTLVERITLAITAGPTPKAVVPGRP